MSGKSSRDPTIAYGLQVSYLGESGERQVAPVSAVRGVLRAMGAPDTELAKIEEFAAAAAKRNPPAIVAPGGLRCHMPDWLETGRAWGVTCQLYGLRSARNCGIGDFEDLACLAERAAADGADFVGVNPLHALFTAAPERCSPFSPSNRRFLNPLYIALDRIPGVASPPPVDDAQRRRLGAADCVDYDAVSRLKLDALQSLWQRIGTDASEWAGRPRRDFETFVADNGAPLVAHARFEALSNFMVAQEMGAGWHGWPEPFRDSGDPAVDRFAAEHDDEVRFHLWLQWIADAQLRDAKARARAAGMRIGLYLDFAVGAAPDGSATWSDPELVVPGANIGAPPDPFFRGGQDWGLAPMSPVVLRKRQFEPYRTVLAGAMRHAGAVRIDHAMSVYRLFWVPHGAAVSDGCYVLYPLPDMLRALADASHANRAIVIGEDLGTVPDGFRETMQRIDMLSCSILFFERTRRGYRTARSYRRNALVSVSTHDLPPLAGWWRGKDIDLLRAIGIFDAARAEEQRSARDLDRHALTDRLVKEQARRRFAIRASFAGDPPTGHLTPGLAAAIHAYLARTPTRLLAVQFEDLCGARMPVNVPGTHEEYPNWRLRAPMTVDEAPQSELWAPIIGAVAHERPRPG